MASVPSCDFTVPPADLSEERRFRQLETFEPGAAATDAAPVRTTSPLTGQPFMRRRSQELQKEASLLPAARAAAQIRDSVYEYPVTLIEGSTGSGKSTQTIQVLLEMQWGNGLAWGIVAQVCPLIEPLVALHSRLEEEMEAWNWIHLATGRGSVGDARCTCALFTTGVLVSAWWDVVYVCSALILDEAHIRSSSYSELFQMVRPLVMQKKLKLVVMSATFQPSKLAEFFGVDNCNTITLDGRLYPLYGFETEKPMAFENDEDVAVALVDLNTSEASTYEGGILTFVRGQSMVERVAAMLTEKVKEFEWLKGWKVLQWFARADDEARDELLTIHDENKRCFIVSTDALGIGKTFPPFRTVISSCDVNRVRAGLLGSTCNSQYGILQEGGRVARHWFLGPGRHILLRQFSTLPMDHEPEIHHIPLHRVMLRLIRDHDPACTCMWLKGEEPSTEKLAEARRDLLKYGVCFNHA